MSNLIKPLNNLRSLRAIARDLSLEELESILEKVTIVVEEKRAVVAEEMRKEQEHAELIDKYKRLLEEDGIGLEELAANIEALKTTKPVKKRAPRPAKYEYLNEEGEIMTWTGQGRTPKLIQIELDKGRSLSEFEI